MLRRASWLFFLTLIFNGWHGHADTGQQETDSLKRVSFSLPDGEEKANNYLLLVEDYLRQYSWDSALRYSEKAMELGYRAENDQIVAQSLYTQALAYKGKRQTEPAFEKLDSALRIARTFGDSSFLAKGLYVSGQLNTMLNNFNEAISAYGGSLEIYKLLNDEFGILANYNAIGNIYLSKPIFDSAAFYYLKAARICDSLELERPLSAIYNNVAKAYIQMGEYDKAIQYLDKSYEINIRLNDTKKLALNHIHYGTAFIDQNNPEKALLHYLKADSIYAILSDDLGRAKTYNNIGEVYERMGKYEDALERYQLAINYFNRVNDIEGISVALMNIADIFSRQGKYDRATRFYDSAMTVLSGSVYYLERKVDILASMANNFYLAGDLKNAYEYLSSKQNLADSLFNLRKAEMIAELTMKYEKERDQARILRLENENLAKEVDLRKRTIQRNLILFASLALILLILFISLYYRQRAVKDKQIAEQRIKRLEEEKKVLAAKALVEGQEEERKRIAQELHDGLGVLLSTTRMQFSTIGDKSPETRPLIEKATKLLEQAASDVRKISHNMMPGLLTKLGLYEAVEDLMDKLRTTEGMTVEAEIPDVTERLPENKEIMVYRIMQEMVNNTLKHANASNISLQMKLSEDKLDIIFSDNGVGFDVEKVSGTKTAGLASIRSRVNFMSGDLELESAPGKGTRYILEIPV